MTASGRSAMTFAVRWLVTGCLAVCASAPAGAAQEQAAQKDPPTCAPAERTATPLQVKVAERNSVRAPITAPFTVPTTGCRIAISVEDGSAFPARDASVAWRLLAQSTNNATLLSLELRTEKDAHFFRSSDVAAADQQLLLPVESRWDGWLHVKRLDLEGSATVQVTLLSERLDGVAADGSRVGNKDAVFVGSFASSGHAFRTNLSTTEYNTVAALAVDYGEHRRTDGEQKKHVYTLISTLTGRRIDTKPIQFSTRSEPIVVFVGLSGLSRLLLLDCQAWPMPSPTTAVDNTDCKRLSEPWQTSLERAEHFWVAYVEDEQGPYDTSIDVEFGAPEVRDYDDFDPQNAARLINRIKADGSTTGAGDTRRVRVGFRRFRLPTRTDAAKVRITRQGSAYGLRSWARSYARYGPSPVRVAGTLAVPGWFQSRRTVSLANVYGADSLTVVGSTVVESPTRQPIFALASLRYPQLRAAAEQADRTWRSFFPDLSAGIALPWIDGEKFSHQTFVLAASWQLAYGSRVHFFAGALKTRETTFLVPVGQRVPLGTALDQVRAIERHWRPIVGISIDLARTP